MSNVTLGSYFLKTSNISGEEDGVEVFSVGAPLFPGFTEIVSGETSANLSTPVLPCSGKGTANFRVLFENPVEGDVFEYVYKFFDEDDVLINYQGNNSFPFSSSFIDYEGKKAGSLLTALYGASSVQLQIVSITGTVHIHGYAL